MTDAERLPIVLCCAEDTEVALVAVVDALHREGMAPEVVPGVETDASLLTAAADRVRGPALFVLCQSDDLDRFQVRRLQGLFSARKGPEHTMLTVDVQAMGPMAVLPEVRVAAASAGSGGGRTGDDDGHNMRDVVMPGIAAAPGASVPPRGGRVWGPQEPHGISDEALGMAREPESPRFVPPSSRDDAAPVDARASGSAQGAGDGREPVVPRPGPGADQGPGAAVPPSAGASGASAAASPPASAAAVSGFGPSAAHESSPLGSPAASLDAGGSLASASAPASYGRGHRDSTFAGAGDGPADAASSGERPGPMFAGAGPLDARRDAPMDAPMDAPGDAPSGGEHPDPMGATSGETRASGDESERDERPGRMFAAPGEADAPALDPVAPPPPRSLMPPPDVLISTDPTGETVTPFDQVRFGSKFGDGVPYEVPEDFPVVGESSQDVEIRGAPNRAGWDHSGPVDVDRVSDRAAAADPRAEMSAARLPSASAPIDVGIAEPMAEAAPEDGRGARIGLLLFAGAGMAGVVAMAAMHGDAPVGPEDVAAPHVERGVPVERPVHEGARAPDDATPPLAGAGSAAAAAARERSGDEDPLGSAGTGGSGRDALAEAEASTGGFGAGAQTEGGSGAGEPPGPEAPGPSTRAPGKSVPPPPTADPSAERLDVTIAAALADGRLEALDSLLVSRAGTETTTWDEAVNRCRRRKVDGVRGWRLPSKGQLVRLRKAKVLLGGSYWSRSVVGGDEVYALDAGTGRLNVWLKVEPNARTVCVRKRP